MTERWVTGAEVIAARDRLEQALGGWQRPAAYAIATGTPDDVVFWRVNVGDHPLPAVVLATVTGYRGGPASYRLSAAVLDEAIAMLAPAEACTEYDHPNLFAWRHLRAELDDNGYATVVFLGALTDRSDDPYVKALLETVHIGKQQNADRTTTLWRPSSQTD